MIGFVPVVSGSPNLGGASVWMAWVDRIVRQKEYAFTAAALVYQEHGIVAACNTEFLSSHDVKNIEQTFCESQDAEKDSPEKVSFQSKSYIIKSCTDNALLAFNGRKHLIVLKSKRMCIVVVCTARRRVRDAVTWLDTVRQTLINNKY